MSIELLYLVLAVCAVVIAVSIAAIALAVVRFARDGRSTTTRVDKVLAMLDEEVPPTLAALRGSARELDALAAESAGRLELIDQLAAEGQETMIAVRDLSASVNEILRGPADTVSGVRRSAKMVGSGISQGADRLRRAITGETGPDELEG